MNCFFFLILIITSFIYKLIEVTIPQYWPGIDFVKNVLLVLTIPAEYSENDKAIMRECIYNAGLISDLNSEKLQFTTERMFN
jgi:hypothetical protein